MRLSDYIEFEPPTRTEVATALGALCLLALGGAGAWWWTQQAATVAPPEDGGAPLVVTSEPAGARVLLDGRERGRTPATLSVVPGAHSLVLRRDGSLDGRAEVQVGAEGAIWRAPDRPGRRTWLPIRTTRTRYDISTHTTP